MSNNNLDKIGSYNPNKIGSYNPNISLVEDDFESDNFVSMEDQLKKKREERIKNLYHATWFVLGVGIVGGVSLFLTLGSTPALITTSACLVFALAILFAGHKMADNKYVKEMQGRSLSIQDQRPPRHSFLYNGIDRSPNLVQVEDM